MPINSASQLQAARLACMRLQGGAECPHLPFGLCPRIWDEAHLPERLADDAAIYGDPFLASRVHWPLWLLAAAAVAALSAVTGEQVAAGGGLLAHTAACGGCVGGYIALELFPGQGLLQVCIPWLADPCFGICRPCLQALVLVLRCCPTLAKLRDNLLPLEGAGLQA